MQQRTLSSSLNASDSWKTWLLRSLVISFRTIGALRIKLNALLVELAGDGVWAAPRRAWHPVHRSHRMSFSLQSKNNKFEQGWLPRQLTDNRHHLIGDRGLYSEWVGINHSLTVKKRLQRDLRLEMHPEWPLLEDYKCARDASCSWPFEHIPGLSLQPLQLLSGSGEEEKKRKKMDLMDGTKIERKLLSGLSFSWRAG